METSNGLAAKKLRFPWPYLLLAYGLSWLVWIPVALTGRNYQTSPLLLALMFLGAFGPGAAGILLTYREMGKEGGRDFWSRAFSFRRIRPAWFALIIFLWPVMHLAAIAINSLMGGSPPRFELVKANATPAGILMVLVLYLLQSGLEELGWRGYMLDRLQALWRPLTAALILGICHAFWHLPTMWIAGTNQTRWNFAWFVSYVVASSIFSSWVYNQNRRSTLAVILLHAVSNLSAAVFLLPDSGERIFNVLLVLGALILAATWVLQIDPLRKGSVYSQ